MASKRTISRRDFLRVASIGTAGAVLAACAPVATDSGASTSAETMDGATQEDINISLISWYNHPFRELLPQFNDLHPDIQVEFIDSGSGYSEKVMTSLISGSELTDIIGSQDTNLHLWAATGGLIDLSEFLAPYQDKIVPYKLSMGIYQGKNYGVPWDGSPCLLYYRQDICEEQGIDPTAIETQDDWLTVGQQLAAATDGKIRLWGLQKNNFFPFINWTFQQGGGMYDLAVENVTIDSPEAIQTLDFLKTLWDSGTVFQDMTWDTQQASYKDGSSVIFPGAIWLANIIAGNAPETVGKWRVAKVPAWTPGGSQAFTWGGSQLAILESSQNKEAAFRFLEYSQLSKAGQEILWTAGDLFPVLLDAVNWEIMNEPTDFYDDQLALRLYAEVNAEVQPYVWGEGWSEAWDITSQAQSSVLDSEQSAEQALTAAADEIRELQGLG